MGWRYRRSVKLLPDIRIKGDILVPERTVGLKLWINLL